MPVTNIFRLPYLAQGDSLTALVESVRWKTVDSQLEALYAFLGNGVISGWQLIETLGASSSITITSGSGVVGGVAAKSSDSTIIDNLVAGTASGNSVNFVYAKLLGSTPYTADVDFVTSTIFYDSDTYLKLGKVTLDKNKKIVNIDMSVSSGRKELTFLNYVLSLIKDHLHTGAAGEPSKIDLQEHVKGILDASFIGNIPASKITGGTISPERFKISHKNLDDIGTLTHAELDSLVEKLQNVNRILFGDIMSANLMQLYLSFKHIWPEIDQFAQNLITLVPGIGNNQLLNNNSYIDINSTTAEVDYINHRIRGKSLPAQEAGQATIRNVSDWEGGSFNDKFIRIINTSLAYGYGYGYGEGLDYFDVFQTSDFNTVSGSDTLIAFTGSDYGYGFGSFEEDNAFNFGYGYGFEYGFGFPETLTSTLVTLQSQTESLEIHNKKIIDTPEVGDGNSYVANDDSPPDPPAPPVFTINKNDLGTSSEATFVREIGILATTTNSKRSAKIDPSLDGVNSLPDDLYSFFSFGLTSFNGGISTESDRSASYIVWKNPIDLTINNTINFIIAQSQIDGNPYDKNWTFDQSFKLILEFSTDEFRFYYRYNTGDSSNRFFLGDQYADGATNPASLGTKYFDVDGEIIDNRARFEKIAEINPTIGTDSGELSFLSGFKLSDSTDALESDAPVVTTLVQNLTGIIIYSDTLLGHNNKKSYGATFIQGQQGKRINLQPEVYDSSNKMLAEIDKIFIGGPIGFNDKEYNNDIQDLIISFPDRVDFESISWVSQEPSDSIVYIQVNRLEEDSDSNYRKNPIFTNNIARGSLLFNGASILPSGSEFPDIYKNIRGLRLKVVLLPTTDKLVAPSINSITVNYLSKTLSNKITVTSQDQWMDSLSVKNLTVSNGTVTIENINKQYGKVQNVIYGTDRAVVETSDNFTTTVKRYSGGNLPTTVSQELNMRNQGLAGFVTDVKKMSNGDIVILDRDESRIIILDQNYDLIKIIASENVFQTSSDIGVGNVGNVAVLVKAIFNRELGDNGILYLVFSHQLKAWPNNLSGNIDTSQMFIKSKGKTFDLSSIPATLDNIVVCDRGILSFKLTEELSNFIENSANPIFQIFLNADNSGVKFLSATNARDGRTDLSISKIGSNKIISNYNLIYAPIRGIVAFDIDENYILSILKRTKVYTWDTTDNVDGVWYSRFSTDRFWTSWNSSTTASVTIDPNIETNLNTISGTETSSSLIEPNFFINNYFGYKGSIQRIYDFLLFSICGDKIVWITKKGSDGKFSQPTQISLPSDGTTPMSAKFDPETTTVDDYSFIYVALSDLRRGSTNNSGKSKVVKIRDGAIDGQEIVWQYGSGISNQETRVVSCNDVYPLIYVQDSVVVST